MRKENPIRHQQRLEIQELQARLAEAEDALRVVRSSEVDAAVVPGPQGDQPYRILVEIMNEGAVTFLPDGTIAYSNPRFSEMVRMPSDRVMGSPFVRFLSSQQQPLFNSFLERCRNGGGQAEFTLLAGDGSTVPAQLSVRTLGDAPASGFCLVITDLSEQKRAEAALRESQALTHAIVEGTSDMIWSVDSESFRLLTFNRSLGDYFLRWCGIRLQIGTGPEEHFPSEDLVNRWRGLYQRALSEGSYTTDYNVTAGSNVLQLTFNLLKRDGRVFAISVFGKNITEHKRAEEALRESEEHFRSLFENMLNGFAYCKMHFEQNRPQDFTYLSVNRAFEALTGLKQVVGRRVSEVIPGIRESDPGLFELYGRVALTGTPERLETFVAALGMWFSIAVYSPKKEYFVAVFDVITERKQVEARLKESELKFRNGFMTGADAFYIATLEEGLILEVNDCFQEVFGYGGEEVIGKTSIQLGLYADPLDRARLVSEVKSKGFVRNMEMRARRKGGEVFPLLISVNLLQVNSEQLILGVIRDVTARKRAEEALRDSEERFRSLVENATVGIYRTTPQGQVLMANPTMIRMLGYKDFEELAARNLEEQGFEPHYPRGAFRQQIEQDGEVRGLEAAWRRRDGSLIFVRESARVVRGESGDVLYYDGIVEDITERKLAEEKLRLTQFSVEHASDAIFWMDAQGQIAYVNDAACRSLGRSREELLSLSIPEIDPLVPKEVWGMFWKEVKERGSMTFETRHQTKQGRVFPVEVTSNYLEFDGKEYSFAFARDISERKQAEAEHIRLVTAIEQAAETVMITDIRGTIEYVNPAFARVTGYSREEVLGQNPRILKSGNQASEFYQQLWATILNGQTWHGELINRRKDGSLYNEEMNIAPVRNPDGEITHFIATKLDVTARKQLEQQFLQAQKMEAVGRLAGGVAHDFNNLLTIINGYAALLVERTSPEDPRHAQLKQILTAGERAASVTRQLLAFSRRQLLEPRVLDLNSVLADVEKMLPHLIGEDVELVTTLKPDLGRVKADPGQIEQVVMNLAVNARDAMPKGGKLLIETCNVEIDENYARRHSPMTPGKYVMVAVSDTGCGMDLETQAHLFEPFFTTKEEGRGTGLGLATVYGIVKQSDGFIWVYSEPGQGSTFKIYFPRVQEALPAAEPSKVRPKLAKGSETVLVAEDEGGVRSLTCEALRSHGYEVLEATGAAQALQIAEQHTEPIHLLLTDVVMPQISGKELVKRLSTLHPETKVLYMSGYTDDAIVRHGILEGGMPFLQKPFAPTALLLKVHEVLETKSGTQQ